MSRAALAIEDIFDDEDDDEVAYPDAEPAAMCCR
jgi:hypothetical protein